jgi:hypothetical protein
MFFIRYLAVFLGTKYKVSDVEALKGSISKVPYRIP